jgi:tetratricopeptide (TPR) repeat protein
MSDPTSDRDATPPAHQEHAGDDAEALSRQARESLDAQRFAEAVALYDRAIAADDRRVNDWINKGLALWCLKRHEPALECYDRALALDSRAALAWMNRGNVLRDLKRPYDEALASYDRALEIDPRLASAWYNKGDALAWMGNFTDAISCFEKARDLGIPDAARLIRRCREIVLSTLNEMM